MGLPGSIIIQNLTSCENHPVVLKLAANVDSGIIEDLSVSAPEFSFNTFLYDQYL
jgi:hypothetical protein